MTIIILKFSNTFVLELLEEISENEIGRKQIIAECLRELSYLKNELLHQILAG